MSEPRLLIVTADEFGRSPVVNEGIVDAHREGVVTGASVLVRMPGAADAARLAGDHPRLALGLQLDLGEWAFREGRWDVVHTRVPPDDADAVAAEAADQLGCFRELFGRDPDWLCSHQSVHRSEPARSVLLAQARELQIPLRDFTREVFVCTEFFGQTSKGEPFPAGITVERLVKLVGNLPRGITELVCHPGYTGDGAGNYGVEREEELRVLTDPRVRAALVAHGVELHSFDRVARRMSLRAVASESSFRDRGRGAYSRGDYEKAEYWFRSGVALDGSRGGAWLWLSRAQMRNGRTAAARISAERAVELLPEWSHALLHMADLLLGEGDAKGGVAFLERALECSNGDREVLGGVVRRLLRLEDAGSVGRVATRLVRDHPGGVEGVLAEALLLWRTGRRGDASRVLARHAGSNGGLSAAASFYLDVGEPRRAWETVRSANGRPVDAALLVRVAHGLRRSGELPLAWEAFERALASDPGHTSASEWRDRVVGEIHVLTGAWESSVRSSPGRYQPLEGRVLHLVGKSLPHVQTGYSVRTRYVTLSQQDAGLDPHVVTQLGFPWDQGVEEVSLFEEVMGVPHHRLVSAAPIPRRMDDRLDRNLASLVPLVRRLRPDVLHAASDYRNALLALALRRIFGIPVVYEVRGFWEETWRSKQGPSGSEDAPAYRWRREMEIECMRAADRVVTLADVMKGELVARGIQEDRIAVVPNAVDPLAFGPSTPDVQLARGLGFEAGDVVLGYVSSLTAYEGIPCLVEAVATLAQRGHRVRGLVVGDGEERLPLEALVRRSGLEGRFVFTGRVPHAEVARYYGLIDIFVVPRTSDRVCRLVTPLKPYEAMAMGRAVVVSGVEALREMVIPGGTGLVFRPDDPASLVEVIEPLLGDAGRRAALGEAARRWVSENRNWRQNGVRYARLYEGLRSGGGRSRGRVNPNGAVHGVEAREVGA
jgi:glycosyltransferase involved in cell wall biosynthesis/predicted glycoside hydrolase/deacetylase ChbG (UPF0249 family)/Flp pilus assembly protein TadD